MLYSRGALFCLGQAFVQPYDVSKGAEQEQATKSGTNTDARFCTCAQT